MMKYHYNKAMGLIDVLIGITLMAIAFLGIIGAYQLAVQVSNESKLRSSAIALANKRIEQIKNMPYSQIGAENGYPLGSIKKEEIDDSGSVSFTVKTDIIYGINCKDGVGLEEGMQCPDNAYGECPNGLCPIDDCPNDYKMIYVQVSWGGRFPGIVKNETIISPSSKEQECQEKGGILLVDVFDSLAQSVSSPLIKIKRISENQEWEATPESGSYAFVLPEASDDYQINVSKDGYSSERTYAVGETYLPSGQVIAMPNKSNPSIFEGQTTEISFIIDKVSDLILDTKQVVSDDIYYVKKNGDDSNNGLSPDFSFLTISKALSKAEAGDMIFVGAGTYNENLIFQSSGISGSDITLFADFDGKYTGNYGDVILSATSTYGIEMSGRNFITIYGFKIKNFTESGIYISNSGNINLINNIIESNSLKAIDIRDSSNIKIRDNDILSNGYGIYCQNSNGLDILGNNISQNGNYGFLSFSCNNIAFKFNSIYSNSGSGFVASATAGIDASNNSIYSNQGVGIKISSNSQGVFANNKIYSNSQEGFLCENSSSNILKNNLIYSNNFGIKMTDSCSDSSILSNTIHANTSDGILIDSSSRNSLNNNIISGNLAGINVNNSTSTTEQYNDIYNNSENYKGINKDDTSINSDPKFINYSGGDFHLSQIASGQQENSPCIDSGSQTASSYGLASDFSTRSDNQGDSGTLDLGFHYFTGDQGSAQNLLSPFGTGLSNVSFKIHGIKTVGLDPSQNLIYKFSTTSQTDSSGYKKISGVQRDNYAFSDFSRSGLSIDLFVSYPNKMPISIEGGGTSTIIMGFKSQNSLIVTVKDISNSNPIFGANVRVYNSWSDQSQISDVYGKVQFLPLSPEQYTLEVSAQDYVTSTETINISGHNQKTVNLSK